MNTKTKKYIPISSLTAYLKHQLGYASQHNISVWALVDQALNKALKNREIVEIPGNRQDKAHLISILTKRLGLKKASKKLKPKKPAQIAYEKLCGPVTIIKESKKPRPKKDKTSKEWLFANSDAFLNSYEWRKVRMEALKLHGARCQCCGATPKDGFKMHVDHIKPRKLFPQLALTLDNLQVLCEVCNHGKGNWDMTDWRQTTVVDDYDLSHIKAILKE